MEGYRGPAPFPMATYCQSMKAGTRVEGYRGGTYTIWRDIEEIYAGVGNARNGGVLLGVGTDIYVARKELVGELNSPMTRWLSKVLMVDVTVSVSSAGFLVRS